MNHIATIRLKAAILLFVFSLNTLIGFACSLDIDMGFNSLLHVDKESSQYFARIGISKKKKKHKHPYLGKSHCHVRNDRSGGCCNNAVLDFLKIAKSISHNNIHFHDFIFVPQLECFQGLNIFNTPQIFSFSYQLPHFHPPPPDIRVVIQSFLI